MRMRAKLISATFVAVLTLAAATGTAAGLRSISVSPSEVRLTSIVTFKANSLLMICSLTLEGTLSRAIPKIEGIAAGSITAARWARCIAEEEIEGPHLFTAEAEIVAMNLSLPWRLSYKSFLGVLPNITGLRLAAAEAGFLWSLGTVFGTIRCLWRGNLELLGAVTRGSLASYRTLEPNLPLITDLSRNPFLACPRALLLTGSLRLETAQTVTLV